MGSFFSQLLPEGSNKPTSTTTAKPQDKESSDVPLTYYDYTTEDFPWVWAIRDSEILDWKKCMLNDDEIMAQAQKQNNLPVHIYGNVYLGNAQSVSNLQLLKDRGITRVLNVAGPFALRRATVNAYKDNGIQYKRVTAQDEEDYPFLAKHWSEVYDFIHTNDKEKAKTAGSTTQADKQETDKRNQCDGNIVIHCVAGMNRSVLAVTADYMISCQQPVLEAVKHVRLQRGNVALQNSYFQEQLVAFARHHDLLGGKPGTSGSVVPDVVVPPPDSMQMASTKAKLGGGSATKFQSLFSDF